MFYKSFFISMVSIIELVAKSVSIAFRIRITSRSRFSAKINRFKINSILNELEMASISRYVENHCRLQVYF